MSVIFRSSSLLLEEFICSKVNSPAGIYLLKVNNRNTRIWCEICSKLTIKTPERHCSGVFVVNFEHISHLNLVFNFKHVIAVWKNPHLSPPYNVNTMLHQNTKVATFFHTNFELENFITNYFCLSSFV